MQPFQAIKLFKEPLGFICVFTILRLLLVLHHYGFNLFQVVCSISDSVCLYLKSFIHFRLVNWVDLLPQERYSFISYMLWDYYYIYCLVKPNTGEMKINLLAGKREREGLASHRTRSVIVLIPQSTFVFPTVYFTLKMLFPSSSSLSHYRETEGTRWGILIP